MEWLSYPSEPKFHCTLPLLGPWKDATGSGLGCCMTSLLVLGIDCTIGFGVLVVGNAMSLLPLGSLGFWM